MSEFDGKVIIITGGAAGIGFASAKGFAKEGAKVVIADINEAAAKEAANSIGENALAVKTDVADESSCQNMVEQALEKFGRVDVLFNNAGFTGTRSSTDEQPTEMWNRVIDINLNGVFYCTKAALPAMKNSGGGVIINTSSVDGLVGMSEFSAYSTAKHGVLGLTKCCAIEYAGDNIRCVAICPGFIDTSMTRECFTEDETAHLSSAIPLGRAAKPEDVANLAIWLASNKASYITGTSHTIDGGILSGFKMH